MALYDSGEMRDNCTVLVMGRDVTVNLCYLTTLFFDIYWKDCKYEKVLCTQTLVPADNKFDRIIYVDNASIWGERLKVALDSISTKYVILLAEDFFLKSKVNNKRIQELIEVCEKEKAGAVRLNPPCLFAKNYNNDLFELKKGNIYRICLQPTLFKVSFLKKFTEVDKPYTPWQFEREGSILSNSFDEKVFCTKESVYDCVHAWARKSWTAEAIHLMCKSNIDKNLYTKEKLYPWYMVLRDKFFILLIRIAPHLITNIRIAMCKNNEKKLKY